MILLACGCVSLTGCMATPWSANAFYNSVGVDTHLESGTSTYGDWTRLVGLVQQLGVKHLADGAYGNPDPSWDWFNNYFDTRVEQTAAAGIKFSFEMGSGPGYTGGSIPQLVAAVAGPLRNAVDGLMDPNEYDVSGDANWASSLSTYDQQLSQTVNATPSLAGLPLIGPSLVVLDSPQVLGNEQGEMTDGAIHPYTGGLSPTPEYTQSQLQRISAVSGTDPVWATEAGYETALDAPAGQQPVSDYVGAVYTLRELLENFSAGISRTYLYELIDDYVDTGDSNIQDHYGLLNSDYSPKPAFTALENLLSLVGEQAPSQLTSLDMSVTQAPDDIRGMLLQQSATSYLVILWRTASIWDIDTRTPIAVPDAPVTLQIPTADTANSVDPIDSDTYGPQIAAQGNVSVSVGPDPVVVKVTTP